MGDLLLLLRLLLHFAAVSQLGAAADSDSSFLHLSAGLNFSLNSRSSVTLLYSTPTLDSSPQFSGLFISILSSRSFNASSSSSQPFGFSLGFYLIPSQLYADPNFTCDNLYGCNDNYLAVCAGSSGNITGAGAFYEVRPTHDFSVFSTVDGFAVPVWVANHDLPIRHVDKVSLIVKLVKDSKGSNVLELQLKDGENVVWRVPNVDIMEIQDTGQLLIYNSSDRSHLVWQSALADSLVQGQILTEGKDQLVSNDSSYVAKLEKGSLVLDMTKIQFNSREGQAAAPYGVFPLNRFISQSAPCRNSPAHAKADMRGDIALYAGSCISNASLLYSSSTMQYYFSWMFWRLESDGMLYSYGVFSSGDGSAVSVKRGSLDSFYYNNTEMQVLSLQWEDCNLPMACGPLGVCTPRAKTLCSCWEPYFEPINGTDVPQGCQRRTDLPSCTSGKGHSTGSGTDFVQLNSTASILLFNEWTFNSTSALHEMNACQQSCLSDCSCNGFFYQISTSSCFFITDGITLLTVVDKNYSSFQDTTKLSTIFAKDYVTFLKVASSRNKTSIRDAVIIALSVFVLVCLVLGMAGYLYRARKKKNMESSRLSKEESIELQEILPLLPSRYSYNDLSQATEGFSKLLGAGGCGSVYAGVLSDGRKVAVKVLQVIAVQAGTRHSKQFLAEIATIGRTNHHNIVRLVGFCWEGFQRLLVYEYVERGSLDRWIFVRESAAPVDHDTSAVVDAPFLDWKTRYDVALGIARGLNYLHEDSEPPILHFDIKPQNILLDNNFVAKLADFGMSRLIGRDISAVVTGMRGTPGYIAPEWCSQGTVSKKSDVYSMGMVLLEIVGGRRNLDFSLLKSSCDAVEQDAWHFPSWAARKCEQGQMMELVDRRLHGRGFDAAQALKLIYITFWCIQEDPAKRPNASTVVQWLEGNSVVQQPPFAVSVNAGRRPNELSAPIFFS